MLLNSCINIILKHQVATVVKKIKKEGFEKGIELINTDHDSDYHFFISTVDEPMRWIAHGKKPFLISRTPDEAQRILLPDCKSVECDFNIISTRYREVVLHGGGYHTFIFRAKPTDPMKLAITYVVPLVYNKRKLFIGTGSTTLPMVPAYAGTELPQQADYIIKLVRDVGLDNALSTIRRENKPRLYAFIIEQDPPYTVLVHPLPSFDGHRANDLRWSTSNQIDQSFSMERLMISFVEFSKTSSGFFAYDYPIDKPDAVKRMKIKVAYIKPFTAKGRGYCVGVTYE